MGFQSTADRLDESPSPYQDDYSPRWRRGSELDVVFDTPLPMRAGLAGSWPTNIRTTLSAAAGKMLSAIQFAASAASRRNILNGLWAGMKASCRRCSFSGFRDCPPV